MRHIMLLVPALLLAACTAGQGYHPPATANADFRVAVARLERARATLSLAHVGELPQTSIGYEADLFGRVKRSIEAADGDADAAAADADAVRVAVVADTTKAYVDAAAAAER